MRITNNIISNNYLKALNGSLEKQSKIQEQLTDGKAVHRPSDDPIKTIRSMRFNTNLAMNEQYTQNLSDAQSWMNNTDGAMSSLSSIMMRAKELVVSADGTKPPDALNAIGVEIDQLINQAINIGNTKMGDRYLFAGQMDKVQPFERKIIKDPTNPKAIGVDAVVYHGDHNAISMQIKPGAVNPAEDSININGADLFGPVKTTYGQPTLEIFNQLIAIKQELQEKRQPPTISGIAGTVTIGGTYTGEGRTNYDVRIDTVAPATTTADPATTTPAGEVQTASYSTDGGNTWNTATISPLMSSPVPPAVATRVGSTVLLPNGMKLDIATDPLNKPNGAYSFHLPSGPDTDWISRVGIASIDAAHSAQLKQQTQLGAKMSTYEMAKNMMDAANTTIVKDVSENEDVDFSTAVINQKNSENVYKSALAVGSKIMPVSLVDFLR